MCWASEEVFRKQYLQADEKARYVSTDRDQRRRLEQTTNDQPKQAAKMQALAMASIVASKANQAAFQAYVICQTTMRHFSEASGPTHIVVEPKKGVDAVDHCPLPAANEGIPDQAWKPSNLVVAPLSRVPSPFRQVPSQMSNEGVDVP